MKQVSNVAYDMDYRGYDPDDGGHTLLKAVCVIIVVFLAIAGIGFIIGDSTPEHAAVTSTESGSMLTIDTSNNALMHKYGLPTKADAMQWHVHGQWGWIEDGKLYAFDELPGDSRAWDELYGIDSDNPAFDK